MKRVLRLSLLNWSTFRYLSLPTTRSGMGTSTLFGSTWNKYGLGSESKKTRKMLVEAFSEVVLPTLRKLKIVESVS